MENIVIIFGLDSEEKNKGIVFEMEFNEGKLNKV